MIKAEILADSITHDEHRLTTFRLTYWRAIHSELMTHRAFSRNAASSRAIPFAKMVEAIKDMPAGPIHWGSAKKGMQSGGEIDNPKQAEGIWLRAMGEMIEYARALDGINVHKSISNRLLEPFAHMVTIVTATDWHNFFALRAHEEAMPEFQALAFAMLEEYQASWPILRPTGAWHLPLVTREERDGGLPTDTLVRMSVARCARVSYLNFKDSTVVEDIARHDSLVSSGHWSPLEHAAQAALGNVRSGNLRGWNQYRKMFPNENRENVDLGALLRRHKNPEQEVTA